VNVVVNVGRSDRVVCTDDLQESVRAADVLLYVYLYFVFPVIVYDPVL
jgi:hypothetical protein